MVVSGLNHFAHSGDSNQNKEDLDIDKLIEAYPGTESGEISSKEAYSLAGGDLEKFYNSQIEKTGSAPNACAVRMSIAMNDAGYSIRKESGTMQGADELNYFLSSKKLFNYIKVNYNVKSIESSNISLTSFIGLKGIYFMVPKNTNDFGAFGHISIWNKNTCLGSHCYNTINDFKNATLLIKK